MNYVLTYDDGRGYSVKGVFDNREDLNRAIFKEIDDFDDGIFSGSRDGFETLEKVEKASIEDFNKYLVGCVIDEMSEMNKIYR